MRFNPDVVNQTFQFEDWAIGVGALQLSERAEIHSWLWRRIEGVYCASAEPEYSYIDHLEPSKRTVPPSREEIPRTPAGDTYNPGAWMVTVKRHYDARVDTPDDQAFYVSARGDRRPARIERFRIDESFDNLSIHGNYNAGSYWHEYDPDEAVPLLLLKDSLLALSRRLRQSIAGPNG